MEKLTQDNFAAIVTLLGWECYSYMYFKLNKAVIIEKENKIAVIGVKKKYIREYFNNLEEVLNFIILNEGD